MESSGNKIHSSNEPMSKYKENFIESLLYKSKSSLKLKEEAVDRRSKLHSCKSWERRKYKKRIFWKCNWVIHKGQKVKKNGGI